MIDQLNVSADDFATSLRERQAKELARYETQHLFLPFMEVAVAALPVAIPAGQIVPIDAPERFALQITLPEGAQIVRTIDPQSAERRNGPVAVYLDEVAPIVSYVLEVHRHAGAVALPVLRGMSAAQAQKLNINRIVFGEAPILTYRGYVERMQAIWKQAKNDEPGRLIKSIADTVLASVETCRTHAEAVLRATHTEMDTARAGNPNAKSRYDRRDLRCLEFLEATPREQALNAVAQQQAQMTTILPAIMDRMAANDERMAALMEQFAAQNAAQTEALKAIAGQGTRGKRDAA